MSVLSDSVRNILEKEAPMERVRVRGWVRTRRDGKDISFLAVNDGSCLENLQAVVEVDSDAFKAVGEVATGAAVELEGALVPSLGKGQRWEVRVQRLEVIGPADPETYPLQKKRHTDEFLRAIAHLRPRTNKYSAMFRLRSEAAFAVHQFFREQGFFLLHAPILTGSDCEGAGQMFRVTTLEQMGSPEEDFFGRNAYLTVSGQLEAEAFATSLGRVYTFGPTFRAENSNTPRHAAEFWMIEPEMAFADLTADMDLAEAFLKDLIERTTTRCATDLDLFARHVDPGLSSSLEAILARPFARLSYTEAVQALEKAPKRFEYPVGWGLDLQTEHERYLAEEFCGRPVFVYDFPKDIKAFYMRLNEDGETVAAMDLLVPRVGEIIGGSQREERLDVLEERIAEAGLTPDDYWWYMELRRYGSVPHAGFGMGFERFLMLLTGVANIRDVIPFPRTPRHLEF